MSDPLARLHETIEQARALPAPSGSAGATASSSDDPLERFRALVAEARACWDAPLDEVGWGDEPLASLRALIRSAASLEGAAEGHLPAGGQADPLEVLRAAVARESDEVGAAAPVVRLGPAARSGAGAAERPETLPPARVTTTGDEGGGATATARLGSELVHLLSESPLDGPTRAEVALRLAALLDAPDPTAVREVLRLVITGRPSAG